MGSKNIQEHQKLLEDFFHECVLCLSRQNPRAEVHVTLKSGEPYSDWKIGSCCTKGSEGLLMIKTARDFDPRCFPEYAHRRTIGFKKDFSADANEEILKGGAKTYIFGWNAKKM